MVGFFFFFFTGSDSRKQQQTNNKQQTTTTNNKQQTTNNKQQRLSPKPTFLVLRVVNFFFCGGEFVGSGSFRSIRSLFY